MNIRPVVRNFIGLCVLAAALATITFTLPTPVSAAPLPTQPDATILSILNANMTPNTPGIRATT